MCKVQNSSVLFFLLDVLIFSEIKLVIVTMFTNCSYFNFCVFYVYAINWLGIWRLWWALGNFCTTLNRLCWFGHVQSGRKYRVIKNDCRGYTQYTPDATPCDFFYGVTSRIKFMFLLFPQVSRNWRYKSEPPLKPSPLTCCMKFVWTICSVRWFNIYNATHLLL